MEQHIVLNGSDRNFEDISNEIGYDRAAATVLRIKVRDIGNRHVEGKLECVIPFGVSVEHRSPESLVTILALIAIIDFRTTQEFFLVIKEPAVMVKVLDYKLKSTILHRFEKT